MKSNEYCPICNKKLPLVIRLTISGFGSKSYCPSCRGQLIRSKKFDLREIFLLVLFIILMPAAFSSDLSYLNRLFLGLISVLVLIILMFIQLRQEIKSPSS